MTDQNHQSDGFISIDLDPDELNNILDRINENLILGKVLHQQCQTKEIEGVFIPEIYNTDTLNALSCWLRMSSAPLIRSIGKTGMSGLISRLLNLPVRIFARSQIDYNNKHREFVEELTTLLQTLVDQNNAIRLVLCRLSEKVQVIESSNVVPDDNDQNQSDILES